ncbi:hypothetical protein AAG747_17985 [Rapidithrix thailandica]|uniref:Uncharacterized protein n=1 Tax=Rapidithrix thailandica TaxID=413964 RepID=A0AAW9S3N4_9BACT
MFPGKKPILIPKHHFKCMFSVDIDTHANVTVSGIRFLEVAYDENLSMNAKFCKHEHLHIGNKYININKLYQDLLNHLKDKLIEEAKEVEGKLKVDSILKSSHIKFP